MSNNQSNQFKSAVQSAYAASGNESKDSRQEVKNPDNNQQDLLSVIEKQRGSLERVEAGVGELKQKLKDQEYRNIRKSIISSRFDPIARHAKTAIAAIALVAHYGSPEDNTRDKVGNFMLKWVLIEVALGIANSISGAIKDTIITKDSRYSGTLPKQKKISRWFGDSYYIDERRISSDIEPIKNDVSDAMNCNKTIFKKATKPSLIEDDEREQGHGDENKNVLEIATTAEPSAPAEEGPEQALPSLAISIKGLTKVADTHSKERLRRE